MTHVGDAVLFHRNIVTWRWYAEGVCLVNEWFGVAILALISAKVNP